VYPIVGVVEYGWSFVGSDIDPVALAAAQRIMETNPALARRIELRRQSNRGAIFEGIVRSGETFAASMCNPPFHLSAAAAAAGTQRKLRNLAGGRTAPLERNFGGRSNELWCPGGEVAFIRQMIAESAQRPDLCRWFTTLVSQRDSLPPIRRALDAARPAEARTIEIAHGQKKTRILAWRFR
jgi:23S rRNA (adenine1618-N6)-methyltransferase